MAEMAFKQAALLSGLSIWHCFEPTWNIKACIWNWQIHIWIPHLDNNFSSQ